jgi:glutamate/aspartate transport system permease protein
LSAYLTFSIFEAAFFAEIIRSGIEALPRGQTHAGFALGLSSYQTVCYIVMPQVVRNTLPVLLTQVIVIFQDTSLVYAIGAYDWLKGFEIAGRNFGRPVESYLLAAASYFTV